MFALCWMLAARPGRGAVLAAPRVALRYSSATAAAASAPLLNARKPGGQVVGPCAPVAGDAAAEQNYERYGETWPGGLYILGEEKARAHDATQAVLIFRSLLVLQPGNLGAELGLAHAFSARGCYAQAIRAFNQALLQSPANYAALQGEAFVLFWEGHERRAMAIFQKLVRRRPADPANWKALADIARMNDLERWNALAPARGASSQAILAYELSFVAEHPTDGAALRRLVRAAAALGDYTAAITALRRAVRASPGDGNLQMQLATVLAWDRQYSASIAVVTHIRQETPDDRGALAMLARLYEWSGHPRRSLALEKELVADEPTDVEDRLAVARLETRLDDDRDARKYLEDVLKLNAKNRDALRLLARLNLREGELPQAKEAFEKILGIDFNDPDALFGEARIDYYLDRPRAAQPLAARLVRERPEDFDALMLLARIDRALRERNQAIVMLKRASRLKPHDSEIAELRDAMSWKSSVSVKTTESYAREISRDSPFQTFEDLSSYGSVTRVSFDLFPRSSSDVLTAFVPVNSPFEGSLGHSAPSELLYGQTTHVTRWLVIRGGLGATRLGPGDVFSVGNPVGTTRTVSIAPVGYFAWTVLPTRTLSLNAVWSHTGVVSTPIAANFGVTRTRSRIGFIYRPNGRTRLSANFFHDQLFSSVYHEAYYLPAPVPLERNGRDLANGGSLDFSERMIRSHLFSFDAGYSGLVFGYAGQARGRGIFMGLFNPPFYQNHFFTTRIYGPLWKRLRYDLTADVGRQQIGGGTSFLPAERIGPELELKIDSRLSVEASYLHYDFTQSLGNTAGNAIQIATSYHF